MKEIQSVAIIGMGALGLLFGDILQRGGAKVCFIADEQRQAKVAHTPITINGEARRFDMIAPDQIGASFDLILFAVKATGLKQAMADAARAIGEDTAIVSLLNGITSEALLAERFGARNVVGCVAQGMDAVREGTSLRYTHPGMLVIGAQDSEQEPALARVAKLFARSDVPFQIDSDIRHRLWSKFMLNVGVNQVVMAAEGTYATVQRAGAARERMIAAMREVIALAQLEGVCVTEDDLRYYVDLMDTLSPDGMPSMRQDGLAHRPSEVELFSGTVCQMAKKHGLSVPINEALYREICTMEADYMNTTKTFHAETVTDEIVRWIQDFFAKNGPDCNTVVGISGGKDSSVAAAKLSPLPSDYQVPKHWAKSA